MHRLGIILARWLRRLAAAGLVLVALLTVAFGLLQTPVGRGWLARTLAGAVSGPGFSVAVNGLAGLVPLRMSAERIDIRDGRGVWASLQHVSVDLSAASLAAGRLRLRVLTAREFEVKRLPETAAVPAPASFPPSWLLSLRRPRFGLAVDRLAVARLVLGPAVLGEPVTAALAGRLVLTGATTQIALHVNRTDTRPGAATLRIGLAGEPPVLTVRLTASEPTGKIVARLLHRPFSLPLSASLIGKGPLAQWRGRFVATAGALSRIDADLALAGGRTTTVTASGTAAIAPLLPPRIAALVGEHMTFGVRGDAAENGTISLDALTVEAAIGTLRGKATIGGPDRTVSARLQATFPDLSPMAGLLDMPVAGSVKVAATVSGSEDRPALEIDASGDGLRGAGCGAEHAEARLSVTRGGNSADPLSHFDISAHGRLQGLVWPDGLPRPDPGGDLDWSVKASAAADASAVEVSKFTVHGSGIDGVGSGRVAEAGSMLDGRLRLSLADLRPFTAALGYPIGGAMTLEATASGSPFARMKATLDASATALRTPIPAIDVLAGDAVTLTAALRRDGAGALVLDRLAVSSRTASFSGAGRFDPVTQQLAATGSLQIPQLQPLGAAFGVAARGSIAGRIDASGTAGRLKLRAELDGRDLGLGAAKLDALHLAGEVPDLALRKATVTGDFHGGGVDGTLAVDVDAHSETEVLVPRLRLQAAGGRIDGTLRIARTGPRLQGTIDGRVPDLSGWSRLAGVHLAGSLNFKAVLADRGGQSVEATVTADRVSAGSGPTHASLGHLAVAARLNDLFGTPTGRARAVLTAAAFRRGKVTSATITLASRHPGRFAFAADAKGRIGDPLTLALGGECNIATSLSAIDLRVARFSASIGRDHIRLTRALKLTKHGNDLSLSDLALAVGHGRITGEAALRRSALSMRLVATDFPIAPMARLAGYERASGTLAMRADLSGTRAAPRGHIELSGQGLSLASRTQHPPTLGFSAVGNWNGRDLELKGKIRGLKAEALSFDGSLPLVMTSAPLAFAIPPQGRLAMRLQGGGELANLADLLPLGEDRLSGRFTLNLAASGTVAAPGATGRLTVQDGRYENFATGAVLKDLRLDLAGDHDRLTLREFTADDTATGHLSVRGSIALAGSSGPSADLAARLAGFRIAARDEAVVTASGTITVAGAIASPKISARLTVDRAECRLPEGLPPSVTRLAVTEINGQAARPRPSPPKSATPVVPAALDIRIALPRRVFVRGHGLDSEWRGQLKIAGTSEAPRISGSLDAVRGSFDLLGKTFRLTRGKIAFDGTPNVDPSLDILAEVATSDITAQVLVGGFASAPTITLSSSPVVPQDEILSRVLFDRGVGQISAGEGLQVAQAAATLAGGGPGVLDRLRGHLGLDRLFFGSAPSGVASSSLNPAASDGAASGDVAVSGGKYVAEGVYVGVTQGTTPGSSKVTVEIDVRPHVTVETDQSQTGGTGIGLNYKYDY
jgi:translocation and assembly module TamB